MTRVELAEKLHHLDPGATLTTAPEVLAETFGGGSLTQETVAVIEAFPLEHRCTFLHDAAGGHQPVFEKDDVF